ncbi:hypothetical protein ABEK96_28175, partial [Klebsiella pneumoniae]
KRAYCLKTQPATGETYPKSDLFNKASHCFLAGFGEKRADCILQHYHPLPCFQHSAGFVE